MSEKWLYGASVQGIQGYIFQTNKLKDVIGASELVKELCETDFKREFALTGSVEYIVKAAGNIKLILDSEEDCKRIVFQFPKYAMEKAPGITLSQAVFKCESDDKMNEARQKLEERLCAQRNRPCKSLTLGCVAMHRSPLTGLPAVPHKDNEPLDEGVLRKREILDENNVNKTLFEIFTGEKVRYSEMGLEIRDLTGRNDWIAIIHADGNSLGELVKDLGKEGKEKLREFSENLDKATRQAAQEAYKKVKGNDEKKHPIRPIVLGGDDLTVICRGDIAIDFVKEYISLFEEKTKNLLSRKLTACAGIAFIKSSYPFSFGYELAETLCGLAKKDAKSDEMKNANEGMVPSCLMFHKVQSSFVEDYESIKQKELTLKDGSSLCYGPYYLAEQKDLTEQEVRWTIEKLCTTADEFAKEKNNSVKTSVREWLTKMHEDTQVAEQYKKRVEAISVNKQLFGCATEISVRKSYPAYDILSLVTIKNQKTR